MAPRPCRRADECIQAQSQGSGTHRCSPHRTRSGEYCCRNRRRWRRRAADASMAFTCTTIVAVERRTYSAGSRRRSSAARFQREPLRNVAVQRIVRAGLVGHHVHLHAAPHNLRQHIGAVPHQANRKRAAFAPRRPRKAEAPRPGLLRCGRNSGWRRAARCGCDQPRLPAPRRRSASPRAAARRPCRPFRP